MNAAKIKQPSSLSRARAAGVPDASLGGVLPVLVVPKPDLHEEDLLHAALFKAKNSTTDAVDSISAAGFHGDWAAEVV